MIRKIKYHLDQQLIQRVSNIIIKKRYCGREFSVITNNCWGAHIYQRLQIEYTTPFVGLFVEPDSYLKLLRNFRWAMQQPLRFQDHSSSERINDNRSRLRQNYPIATIGGEIEINFLHYSTSEEANEKWVRRSKRIVAKEENIFVKFCDVDNPTPDQIRLFESLPFENKVCFVSKAYPDLHNTIHIHALGKDSVPDGLALSKISYRQFDAISWLNGNRCAWKWPILVSA